MDRQIKITGAGTAIHATAATTSVDQQPEQSKAAASSAQVQQSVEAPQMHPYYVDFLRSRYIDRHASCFNRALGEIKAGSKQSCWQWFVVPAGPWVVNGRERGSGMNSEYALRDHDDDLSGLKCAQAYLKFPEVKGVHLRSNTLAMLTASYEQMASGNSLLSLYGFLDKPKYESHVKIFEKASRDGFDPEVNAIATKTLKLLKLEPLP